MSSRGEIAPELAAIIREIAERIRVGAASADDAENLDKIARAAANEDPGFALKIHRKKRGRVPYRALIVDRSLFIARAIKAYREEHDGCTLRDAYSALSGTLNVDVGSLEDAWQKMGPLLDMSEESLKAMLFFMRLKANGVPIEFRRVERPK